MDEDKKSFYQWQRQNDAYRSVDGNGDCLSDCGCDECMNERFDAIGVKMRGWVMDIDKVKGDWCNPVLVKERKPTIEEACETIMALIVEISQLKQGLEKERGRQDIEKQKYKTMLLEIQNTVTRYT